MVKHALNVGRYLFLILLTLVATGVMYWVSRPNIDDGSLGDVFGVSALPTSAAPKSLVNADQVEPIWSEVKVAFSGKVRAWETYSLGFEVGGRVSELGIDASGRPLDDGARVIKGQILARIDDRVLKARQDESAAQLELAGSDLERSRRIRENTPGAISEADYQSDLTQFALRRAAHEIAMKNLDDSALVSPVDGVIFRRMVEPGESVNPNTSIFEIVQNNRLRLVLSVPESRIRELEMRRRMVVQSKDDTAAALADQKFKAYVKLEGTDVRGRPWPAIEAEVHHIAEMADEATGLFEVEVLIPNDDGLLRPGMVATSQIVTDHVLAYQVPEQSVLFRAGKTYLYTVDEVPTDMKVMFWNVSEGEVYRARRVEIFDWIDQGQTMLLPASSYEINKVVTRGQQRLRDGQLVRVVPKRGADLANDSSKPNNTKPIIQAEPSLATR